MKMENRYKKIIISVAGVSVFLIAGVLTMMFKPVEKFEAPKEQVKTEPEKIEIQIQEDWYIHVAGEVRRPGVYKLSPDSRIFQAVEKAGGFTARADRDSINMAEKLAGDGLQIYIAPKQEELKEIKIPGVPQTKNQIQPQARRTSNINTGSVMIDINTATAKELEQIKGIGPAIAKRIVEYREVHGRFQRPEDLINIRGIGEKTLEKMRPQIVIR